MKILVANHWLKKLGGSETFTYTLIGELVRQGHEVEYFTYEHGMVSKAIERDFEVPMVKSESFDLILCSHNTTVRFCRDKFDAPIIQTCHGTIPSLEQPQKWTNGEVDYEYCDAYVAISEEVELHLLKCGVTEPIKLIRNGIDLERFRPSTVASASPSFILSLSHSQELNDHLEKYFTSRGAHFEALNKYRNPKWEVEKVINLSDLVISVGRGVMESMACGRPVLVMDHRPYMSACADGVITERNIERLLFNNLSGRTLLRDPYDENLIDEAIESIDIYTSDKMRYLARKYFNVQDQVQKYLQFYESFN